MQIESKKKLFMRIAEVEASIRGDDRYPSSNNILAFWLNEDLMPEDVSPEEFLKGKIALATDLQEADGAYPMHPAVALLVVELYEDAIEAGNDDAMCNLGAMYYDGRAGEQDYEKAAFFYDMADRKGNRQATENLGYIYYYGRTGKPDYEKAFQYFVKAAMAGLPRAKYKLGDFYRNGYYVEKDEAAAFEIYARCVMQLTDETTPEVGADVFMRLGDCYYEGFGTAKNYLLELDLMTKAEGLFYRRLQNGDFYQKENIEHVLKREKAIRKKIREEVLPDLSWAESALE